MMERSMAELLAEHPFTSDLSEEQRENLGHIAKVDTFAPNDFLIQEGRPADAFFLIVNGLVAIELFLPGRGVQRLQTVAPGSAVGWSWMVVPNHWEFDARALESTTAIILPAFPLQKLIERDCDLGFQLTRKLLLVVAERLKAARLQLLDVYGPPAGVG